jgi:hypothetical protein
MDKNYEAEYTLKVKKTIVASSAKEAAVFQDQGGYTMDLGSDNFELPSVKITNVETGESKRYTPAQIAKLERELGSEF